MCKLFFLGNETALYSNAKNIVFQLVLTENFMFRLLVYIHFQVTVIIFENCIYRNNDRAETQTENDDLHLCKHQDE